MVVNTLNSFRELGCLRGDLLCSDSVHSQNDAVSDPLDSISLGQDDSVFADTQHADSLVSESQFTTNNDVSQVGSASVRRGDTRSQAGSECCAIGFNYAGKDVSSMQCSDWGTIAVLDDTPDLGAISVAERLGDSTNSVERINTLGLIFVNDMSSVIASGDVRGIDI